MNSQQPQLRVTQKFNERLSYKTRTSGNKQTQDRSL